MKSKRRIILLLLAAILCAGLLVGCTSTSGGDDGSASAVVATEDEAAVSSVSEPEADESTAPAETGENSDSSAEATISPIVGEEIEVGEAEEVEEGDLDEQYTDFTDADVSLPIIP